MKRNKKLLGEIMMTHGFISVEHIIRARYKQINDSSKKIGECLVEMGCINRQQLAYAIREQNPEQR
ncbi:MAG: hypothetical protein A2509_01035 [Candidatus Edwardsbacteria bacterium RIFOXYD12_FULL_50_11]|jgi:hypothetical protein|uniref:Type II secretion system protein GspE N-terminal domain-containing protein n=1 Tax=Candidatus Edwardsbacteria bacterium GWF2_54_11 TaxID=1817851 RepID=A0A1F5RC81_9BACT|nr:MAG: hypothetical protein A2502_07445 [Candidatus Edwardsbacteria bacterium RifOxyC12_full_54_24]OGF07567.1 MAG: hypothetical protein A2273_03615 [Candidatus Edwardsbacteria bacterium RifOxyA12_full_54_48]OGF09817.1 MAG: hypothetical protein A3K15_10025 [Candidatus Edwardsbacteria bacterium GWE2_54_12]OGF12079.1 MAG: hypothetical protein A2024_03580 [Candidatus Edwardsbacteria bacterium GWF2_54_11]OGF16178.1 MAG: hypothetical protein A2509_01035 [Candidatus Edwardsbacteria bacterium RIFOXYD1